MKQCKLPHVSDGRGRASRGAAQCGTQRGTERCGGSFKCGVHTSALSPALGSSINVWAKPKWWNIRQKSVWLINHRMGWPSGLSWADGTLGELPCWSQYVDLLWSMYGIRTWREACTPTNAKQLYNICTMLDQRRRRWAGVVQMLYKCSVFARCSHLILL